MKIGAPLETNATEPCRSIMAGIDGQNILYVGLQLSGGSYIAWATQEFCSRSQR